MINRFKFKLNQYLSFLNIYKEIICIGDSHASVFDYINYNSWFSGYYFRTLIIHGATASGIQNPNSTTKARIQFDNFIDSIKNKNNFLVIQLGEVDCGFVIWYRAEKLNISAEYQLQETIFNYQKFILSCKNKIQNCIIMSAVLPTIQDNQNFGEIANLRKEVKASLVERTALTIKFNKLMEQFCVKNNILFLNIESQILDKNTKTVKKEFLNENPLDHHLSNKRFGTIILSELNKLVK